MATLQLFLAVAVQRMIDSFNLHFRAFVVYKMIESLVLLVPTAQVNVTHSNGTKHEICCTGLVVQ